MIGLSRRVDPFLRLGSATPLAGHLIDCQRVGSALGLAFPQRFKPRVQGSAGISPFGAVFP